MYCGHFAQIIPLAFASGRGGEKVLACLCHPPFNMHLTRLTCLSPLRFICTLNWWARSCLENADHRPLVQKSACTWSTSITSLLFCHVLVPSNPHRPQTLVLTRLRTWVDDHNPVFVPPFNVPQRDMFSKSRQKNNRK